MKPVSSLGPREKDVSRAIRTALEMFGCRVWSTETTVLRAGVGKLPDAGVPDLVVFAVNGKWTFAEVKTAKGRLSREQQAFKRECLLCGAPWELWRSAEDAVAWLRG